MAGNKIYLFIYSLFNETFNSLEYIESYEWMISE
jgi:hypothetical protein